jgi:hypothetical protein
MADEQQLRLMDIADWPLNEVNAFVVLGKGQSWETRIKLESIKTSTGGGYVVNNDHRGGVFTGLEPVEIGYQSIE